MTIQFHRGYAGIPAFRLMILFIGSASAAFAQETIRMSLASAEAAEARRRTAATVGYYNLKIGSTAWRFGAGLGLEYNDNVRLEEEDPDVDFIFRPQINAQMLWPVTDKNAINLSLGGGYAAYVKHPELDRLYITPGSELSFDLYIGDFWINLHDRFSITENSYQDPTVTGTGDYSRLENAIGLAATWDLNRVLLRGGYDHVNYVSLGGNVQQADGESELLSTSAGYIFKPGLVAGIELGGGLLTYTGPNAFFHDAKQWNAGVFLDSQLSQHITARGSVGYTDYAPENRQLTSVLVSGTNISVITNSLNDLTGVYGQLELQHQVNQFVAYALSAGHSISYAFYGNSVDLTFVRLRTNWRIMRKVTIEATFDYEVGTEDIFSHRGTGVGSAPENFDRCGAGCTLIRSLTAKASASLGYQFYNRSSDVAGRAYTDNIISLNLNYQF